MLEILLPFAARGRAVLAGMRRVAAFARSRSGVAAVEFAIILPVALMIYIGAAEVSDGVLTSRRVTTVSETLVNLLSLQGTTTQSLSVPTPGNAVTATTLSSLLTSATAILSPYPTSTLTMTISAVDVTNTLLGTCCSALVRWSYTQGGTLRPCIVQMTALPSTSDYSATQIPSGLLPTGSVLPSPVHILIADVGYTYQPIINTTLLNFAPTMQRSEYMFPRATGQVTTATLPASGSQYGRICY